MLQWLVAYGVAAVVMAGLDFVWLRLTGDPLYRRVLGELMAPDPNMRAAVAFYVLYVTGIVVFAVRPALIAHDWRAALLWGALFGLFTYGTYDLTNMATLKVWSLSITLIDMTWGTVLTALAGSASAAVVLALYFKAGSAAGL